MTKCKFDTLRELWEQINFSSGELALPLETIIWFMNSQWSVRVSICLLWNSPYPSHFFQVTAHCIASQSTRACWSPECDWETRPGRGLIHYFQNSRWSDPSPLSLMYTHQTPSAFRAAVRLILDPCSMRQDPLSWMSCPALEPSRRNTFVLASSTLPRTVPSPTAVLTWAHDQ